MILETVSNKMQEAGIHVFIPSYLLLIAIEMLQGRQEAASQTTASSSSHEHDTLEDIRYRCSSDYVHEMVRIDRL